MNIKEFLNRYRIKTLNDLGILEDFEELMKPWLDANIYKLGNGTTTLRAIIERAKSHDPEALAYIQNMINNWLKHEEEGLI